MSYHRSKVTPPETICIPQGLKVGAQIIVQGKVPHNSSGFAINFQCGEHQGCDIAFHFNPRSGPGETVRNHFQGGWGSEERGQPIFPFHPNSKFQLRIYVSEEDYRVTVNGKDFCHFRHRIPLEQVRYILLGQGAEYYDVSVQNATMVPYLGQFPNGLRPGQAFRLRGTVHRDATGFAVNLQCDRHGETIAYHFNVRHNENTLVQNTKIGSWGPEERRSDKFPFNKGDYFDAFFIATESTINVYVNEDHYTSYNHRCPVEDINFIAVNGDLSIASIEFFDPLPNDTIKEIPSGLNKSDMIVAKGFFYPEGNMFSLNLLYGLSPDDDIAFHFNPRRNEGQVVMNCRHHGAWGTEEREPIPSAFQNLLPFELKVVAKKKKFKVYVNQKKFTEFKARGHVEDIKSINFKGDVYMYQAKIIPRPDTPHIERIPGNLRIGSWVFVHGTTKKDAKGFVINLQCGESENYSDDVALHFNPRLNEATTIRNSLRNGSWEEEERHQPNFPFKPNDPFEIAIGTYPEDFRVFVNGHHYVDFKHRIDLQRVCHVMLGGDANFFEPEFH